MCYISEFGKIISNDPFPIGCNLLDTFFVIQNLVLRHTFRFLGFLSAVKRDLIRD